jgi:hypothetical protein
MRFRAGMALGFAAGYVLGAKAGRYRYEQIMKVAGRVWESEPVDKAREQAGKMVGDMQTKASDGLRSVVGRSNDEPFSTRAVTLP